MNQTDTHDAADVKATAADEAPATGAPLSSAQSLPPPSAQSLPPPLPGAAGSSSFPPAPAAAFANRFASGAPLAPPRPGPSSGPPRASFMTPAPPSVRLAGPPGDVATEADAALLALREQLESTQRALAAKQTELRTVLVQRDARIAEVALLQRELETLRQTSAARVQELEQELAQALAEAHQKPAAGDDLQLIRGIGPAFARELKRLGVRTFEQIAAWTDDDVRAIAPKIKARVERIRRDDWLGSAAQLVAERTRR